ncbi:hypothetical protein F511_35745 [Dorcoceras hygrometricum]|uniref:Uncharacterized protein n=1 Tax=Dorcoceras hygrometricum TaxID=472368 RepID=A0A2Z7BIT9_9LAMI|nr:hypothetical protein F511_35745 [Dorcoceras hygrometricum]
MPATTKHYSEGAKSVSGEAPPMLKEAKSVRRRIPRRKSRVGEILRDLRGSCYVNKESRIVLGLSNLDETRSWKRPQAIPELFLQNPGVTSDLSEARQVGVLGKYPELGVCFSIALAFDEVGKADAAVLGPRVLREVRSDGQDHPPDSYKYVIFTLSFLTFRFHCAVTLPTISLALELTTCLPDFYLKFSIVHRPALRLRSPGSPSPRSFRTPPGMRIFMQLIQIKRLGPGKFYISHKGDHTYIKGNPSSHKGWMSRFFYIKCDSMRDPWRCEMHWRDNVFTLAPRTPDRAPSLTPFLEAMRDERMGKAELLRAMQEEARTSGEVGPPKKTTKKRKAPSSAEKEVRHERRKKGTSSSGTQPEETREKSRAKTHPTATSEEIPDRPPVITIAEAVSSGKGPESTPPFDPSKDSLVDSPSAVMATRYICNMAPDRDVQVLKKANDAEVVGHFSANIASAMGQHTEAMARLEELAAHRARELEAAKTQRESLEAELAAEKGARALEREAMVVELEGPTLGQGKRPKSLELLQGWLLGLLGPIPCQWLYRGGAPCFLPQPAVGLGRRLAIKNQQEDFALLFQQTKLQCIQSQRKDIKSQEDSGEAFDGPDASAASSRWEIQSRATVSSRKKSRRKELKKKQSTAVRSVALKWKEDKIAFWRAEEFWKLSNGKIFTEAIYWRQRPLKMMVVVQLRDDVGATTYCVSHIVAADVQLRSSGSFRGGRRGDVGC